LDENPPHFVRGRYIFGPHPPVSTRSIRIRGQLPRANAQPLHEGKRIPLDESPTLREREDSGAGRQYLVHRLWREPLRTQGASEALDPSNVDLIEADLRY